jgi:hypothetical protein
MPSSSGRCIEHAAYPTNRIQSKHSRYPFKTALHYPYKTENFRNLIKQIRFQALQQAHS